jgi:hypothetical protein
MPGFYRRITCRTLAPALLFSIFLLFPLGAEAGLPQVAISIPTNDRKRLRDSQNSDPAGADGTFLTGAGINSTASRVTSRHFSHRRVFTEFRPARILLTRLPMADVHYGFNVMDLVKVDGMYAYARARNLDESPKFPVRHAPARHGTRWMGIFRATTPAGPCTC